jgi:transcription initiation factor TFIIIB Brf1 subunit/transcription initiation factor TFIIB
MSTFIDGEKMDFDCPNCGQNISATVGRLKRGDYSCPKCGAVADTKELNRTLDQAERDVAEAELKIKKIFGG